MIYAYSLAQVRDSVKCQSCSTLKCFNHFALCSAISEKKKQPKTLNRSSGTALKCMYNSCIKLLYKEYSLIGQDPVKNAVCNNL